MIGSGTALPGTEPGSVNVTPFSQYPPKGRARPGASGSQPIAVCAGPVVDRLVEG